MNRYLSLFSCKTWCLITGMIFFSAVDGQTGHYLFIQTENNQPFYLRLMGANLSSNASGYLLIPKLTNGEYELNVGFAQSDKEQKFVVKVEGKDLGFSLKQELDNTWSLFNLVDFTLLRGVLVNIQPKEEKKQSELEIPAEPVKPILKEAAIVKEVVPSPKPVKILPEIKKIYDKASDEGIDMVFVVSGSPKNDTVILYVPALKPKGGAGITRESIKSHAKEDTQATIQSATYLVFTRPKLF
ncbi:MAG: hypothetical protein IBJ16_06410 [Chitinophagaceae bacterium]|nr:hypothetical protein [Chitinophagaceae bacterium]